MKQNMLSLNELEFDGNQNVRPFLTESALTKWSYD